MKSRIFLLIIVLLSTLQISFANNKIDNLFKKTKVRNLRSELLF